ALGGLTLFGVVIGLIGFLIAFAARSVVAGIGFGLGLTTVLPMLAALGKSVPLVATLGDLLPTQAARQMFMAVPGHGGFAGGLGIALIWIVAGLNVTAVLFGRKDA
ncbi:MAG: hypothetical protein LBS56_04430, partial [Propionibacteriaceae bacterium]|nr:hypothetical protein [Propionibacteriaceae bacterium]